jgi:hypothetical protein
MLNLILCVITSCSKPVPTAASKRIFQMATFTASMYLYFRTIYCSIAFENAQRFVPAPLAVRFTVLGLRDQQRKPSTRNLMTVGLLLFGCKLPPGKATWDNESATVLFPASMNANGYYIELNDGPPEEDPVQWMLETTSSGYNDGWALKGASGWRSDGGDFYFFPSLRYPELKERNGTIMVDMTPSWNWAFVWIVDNCISAVGWLSFAVIGATGWHKVGTATATR